MFTRLRWMAACSLLLLVILALASPAQAKSYRITNAKLFIALAPDGSLDVTEERTFRFSGDFSYVYQRIKLPDRSSLTGLTLTEAGQAYRPGNAKLPATYTETQQSDGVRLDWYFQARDQERTFTLKYRITNAIRMHPDTAELYWQVVGSEWAQSTDHLEALLQLPGQALDVRTENTSGFQMDTDDQLVLTRENLPANQSVAVRLLLPRSAVPQSSLAPDNTPMPSLPKMDGAGPEREDLILQVIWLAVLLGLGAWFVPSHVLRPDVARLELGEPKPLPPAFITRLTGGKPLTAFRATLLDLSAKGAIKIKADETGRDWLFVRAEPAPPLAPWEHQALSLFFPIQHPQITLTHWLATQGKRTDIGAGVQKWFSDLRDKMPEDLVARQQFLPYVPVLVTVLLLAHVPYRAGTTSGTLWIVLALVGGLLLILTNQQRQWTVEGFRQKAMWEQKGKALNDYSGAYSLEELAIAVGLGLNTATVPGLTIAWLNDLDVALNQSRYMYADSGGGFSDGGGSSGGDGGGGGGAG